MSISQINLNPRLAAVDTDVGTDSSPTVDLDLESVIDSFLLAYPEPTDEQVHAFARSVGVDYDILENKVYEMLGDIITKGADTESNPTEDQDPLDTFILAFFMFNKSPSDDQIHHLAGLIGVSREELEERIFRMLATFNAKEQTEDNVGDNKTGLGEFSSNADYGTDFPGEADTGADEVDSAGSVNKITIAEEDRVGVGAESPEWEGSEQTTPLARSI